MTVDANAAARVKACAAVVFDLDDTLYLERQYVRSGAREAARAIADAEGLDPARTERELLAAVEREPSGDPFGCWLRLRGLPPERLATMLARYRSHPPAIELEPGVERLLDRLARTRALGLVSDGRLAQQRAKVEALGLRRWPFAVVLSDELGRDAWKPSPLPFLRVLELLGVEPKQAVYVGDNPTKDFLGARRAGLLSIRLRRRGGLHAHTEPRDAAERPDLETASLRGLQRLLLG